MRRQSNYVTSRYCWLCAALSGRLGYGFDREGIKPAPAEARPSHHGHGGLVVHPVWRAEQGVVAREELVPVLGAPLTGSPAPTSHAAAESRGRLRRRRLRGLTKGASLSGRGRTRQIRSSTTSCLTAVKSCRAEDVSSTLSQGPCISASVWHELIVATP